MSGYHAWLYAYIDKCDGKVAKCPECAGGPIEVVVARHPDSDVGWAIMYCPDCRKGARISRMNVTDDHTYVSTDELVEIVPSDIELIY